MFNVRKKTTKEIWDWVWFLNFYSASNFGLKSIDSLRTIESKKIDFLLNNSPLWHVWNIKNRRKLYHNGELLNRSFSLYLSVILRKRESFLLCSWKRAQFPPFFSALNSNNTFFVSFACLFIKSVHWTFPRKSSNFYVFDCFLGSFYDIFWICMFLFLLLNWCLHSLKVYLEMEKLVPQRCTTHQRCALNFDTTLPYLLYDFNQFTRWSDFYLVLWLRF